MDWTAFHANDLRVLNDYSGVSAKRFQTRDELSILHMESVALLKGRTSVVVSRKKPVVSHESRYRADPFRFIIVVEADIAAQLWPAMFVFLEERIVERLSRPPEEFDPEFPSWFRQ